MTIYILTGPRHNNELPLMIHRVTDDGEKVTEWMNDSTENGFVSIPMPDFYRDKMDLIQHIGRAEVDR